jgi:ERCC4-type nuclease
VIASLLQIKDVDVSIQRLPIGDYQIDKGLIVERKTIKDFAVSIIDGRLFKQMIRLVNSTSTGVLILEGGSGDLTAIGMTREALQGALITISIILGIPVLRSNAPSETAKLIVYIGRQIDSLDGRGVHRSGYRPKSKHKRQLFILQGLPGIGPERAERLLDRFGSVEAAISADSDELQSVDGIGKNVAKKIKWAVREQVAHYYCRSFSPGNRSAKTVTLKRKTITSHTKDSNL